MATINGTNTPDVLTGAAENDLIRGWNPANAAGDEGPATDDDVLNGADGSDTVFGGGGDDQVSGGNTGADRLVGGAGNDTLNGSFSQGVTGNDTLIGGAGNDTFLDQLGDKASISGGGGDDTIRIGTDVGGKVRGDGGEDSLTLARGPVGAFFGDVDISGVETLYTEDNLVTGTAKQFESFDTIALSSIDLASRVFLSVKGGGKLNLADEVGGRGVSIGGGDLKGDNITTGEGLDRLSGFGGDDLLNGAGGNDIVEGYADNDTLYGEAGDDVLNGFGENDRLVGGSGLDSLLGGDGDDTLDGGSNVLINGIPKGDTIDGGTGHNTLSYATARFGVSVDLSSGQLNDQDVEPGKSGDALGDTIANIQSVIGTNKTDDLRGNDQANRLFGGGDDDDLEGAGGADTLNGGDGDDDLIGGAGSDRLIGGDGVDSADYSNSEQGVRVNIRTGKGARGDAEGDTFSSVELVIGSRFGDVLTGASKSSGGLFSEKGLVGGDGDDTLIGGKAGEYMIGVASLDINLESFDGDVISYANSSAGVRVELGAAVGGKPSEGDADYGLVTGGRGGDAEGDVIGGFAHFIGSKFGDVLTGYAGLFATAAGDPFEVDSRIDGGGGNDTLQGGFGSDTLIGGAGADTATWADALRLADAVVGPTDKFLTIDLEKGRTSGLLESKGDKLSSIENVVGSAAADVIIGSKGDNRLNGGAGSDTLTGGLGHDVLIGGKNADRFDFGSVKDSSSGKNRDVILDFSHKDRDRIDLRDIDANSDKAKDQAFDLIGTKKFTGDEGDLRIEKSGKHLFVLGDVDGDKSADFSIDLGGIGGLVGKDFLL